MLHDATAYIAGFLMGCGLALTLISTLLNRKDR